MTDKKYTNSDKIQEYLTKTITDNLSNYILSAQSFIENYTDTVFSPDDVASARLYDGKGGYYLHIDDCVEISMVEQGSDGWGTTFTELVLANYLKLPNNALVKKLPYSDILSKSGVFYKGIQNQRVTAKWGAYVEIPDDVKYIATILAAGMYNNAKGGGAVKSESIDKYSVTYEKAENWEDFKRIYEVLDRYKKIKI